LEPTINSSARLCQRRFCNLFSFSWQCGAISQDTLLHKLRTGEILPSARTNEEELELIRKEPAPIAVASGASAVRRWRQLKGESRPGWVRSSILKWTEKNLKHCRNGDPRKSDWLGNCGPNGDATDLDCRSAQWEVAGI